MNVEQSGNLIRLAPLIVKIWSPTAAHISSKQSFKITKHQKVGYVHKLEMEMICCVECCQCVIWPLQYSSEWKELWQDCVFNVNMWYQTPPLATWVHHLGHPERTLLTVKQVSCPFRLITLRKTFKETKHLLPCDHRNSVSVNDLRSDYRGPQLVTLVTHRVRQLILIFVIPQINCSGDQQCSSSSHLERCCHLREWWKRQFS